MNTFLNQITKFIPRYLFVCGLGILLHFTYDISNKNAIVGLFSAVNESTWEHLKLIFFPFLFLTIWDVARRKHATHILLPARTTGILAGMFFIVIAFYTLTGVFGTLPGWLNILIYFFGVAVSFWVENRKYNSLSENKLHESNENNKPCVKTTISAAILITITILFFIFTFYPPDIGLFISPV